MIHGIISSDKETERDLLSDSEAFDVEQVLSLIISYLGGKKINETNMVIITLIISYKNELIMMMMMMMMMMGFCVAVLDLRNSFISQ